MTFTSHDKEKRGPFLKDSGEQEAHDRLVKEGVSFDLAYIAVRYAVQQGYTGHDPLHTVATDFIAGYQNKQNESMLPIRYQTLMDIIAVLIDRRESISRCMNVLLDHGEFCGGEAYQGFADDWVKVEGLILKCLDIEKGKIQ